MQYTLTTLLDADCQVSAGYAPDASDALSAPIADNLLSQTLALLPTGAAWGTPDCEAPQRTTTRAKLWRAIAEPMAEWYGAAFGVALQAKATTALVSIPDWEIDLDLPDPCGGPLVDPELIQTDDVHAPLVDESGAQILDDEGFVILVPSPELQDLAVRRLAVLAKVRSAPTMRPADYVCLAWSMGYQVDVLEMDTFRCGVDECGDDLGPDWAEWEVRFIYRHPDMPGGFECAESECGGDDEVGEAVALCDDAECGVVESGDPLGTLGFPWPEIEWFECGESECGEGVLGAFPFPRDLRCRIEAVVPVESVRSYAVPLAA